MGYNGDILYTLVTVLEKEESIELMPRRVMEEILYKSGLPQGDNPSVALKAGKALGVRFVLFGQVTKTTSNIQARLKLLDVRRNSIISTWHETFGSRETIAEKMPEFSRKLVSAMQRTPSSPVYTTNAPTEKSIRINNFKVENKDNKVFLYWEFDTSQPIASFNIYRSKNLLGPYQSVGKTRKNSFYDSSITKGHTYYYRVGIVLQSGQEIKSPDALKIRDAGGEVPHPPLIMKGEGHIRRTTITFVPSLLNEEKNFKITEYEIYRKENPDDQWELLKKIDGKSRQGELEYHVEDTKNLADGKTYIYAITSVESDGAASPLSDPIRLTTISRPTLTLKQDNLLRKIKMEWKPLTGVEGYTVYRKESLGNWKKVDEIKNSRQIRYTDDKGIKDGTSYLYYITAFDEEKESGPSNEIEGKTKELPPYPSDFEAKSGMVGKVLISWSPVDDPDVGGYAIYRKNKETGKYKLIEQVKGYRSGSYLDKGGHFSSLENGVTYSYVIASYNLFGAIGPFSEVVRAKTKPPPEQVRGVNVAVDQQSLIIQWNGNPEKDIVNYTLYRSENEGRWSKLDTVNASTNSYTDLKLKPGVVYRYRVLAEDADGLVSKPGVSATVISPVPMEN